MIPGDNKPALHPKQSLLPRESILLVEEDESDLKCFTTLLGRMGYSVRTFMKYREAEGCLRV
jgi:DNA-binding NtrC family response regulator